MQRRTKQVISISRLRPSNCHACYFYRFVDICFSQFVCLSDVGMKSPVLMDGYQSIHCHALPIENPIFERTIFWKSVDLKVRVSSLLPSAFSQLSPLVLTLHSKTYRTTCYTGYVNAEVMLCYMLTFFCCRPSKLTPQDSLRNMTKNFTLFIPLVTTIILGHAHSDKFG